MRLIDAEQLKYHYAWWRNEEKETFDTIIDLQPTIDAAPVRRGKWIIKETTKDFWKATCSECGEDFSNGLPLDISSRDDVKPLWQYCPICGAKNI